MHLALPLQPTLERYPALGPVLYWTLSGIGAVWWASVAGVDRTYEIGHPLGPLPLRVGLAAVVTAYGAWSGRAWLVPIAIFLAVPGLWAFNWGLLAAVPRLLSPPRLEHKAPVHG